MALTSPHSSRPPTRSKLMVAANDGKVSAALGATRPHTGPRQGRAAHGDSRNDPVEARSVGVAEIGGGEGDGPRDAAYSATSNDRSTGRSTAAVMAFAHSPNDMGTRD